MPDGSMEKALFPFSVPIDKDFMETWKLEAGGEEFAVANPAATLMNYLTRSVSGLRAKDYNKVQEMAAKMFAKAPELAEWAVSGPGKSHKQLADILHTLRYASADSGGYTLIGGEVELRAKGSLRELLDDEAFMLPDASRKVQEGAIAVAAIKSRGLGFGESNEAIVGYFQRFFEERLHAITRNS